ncbi:MAG: hypothetical protein IT529_02655 [Burkholderiales bacterium]|nr:hypothetical protein [Burkholderiales bacterium]
MAPVLLRDPESGAGCELELGRGLAYAIEARTAAVAEALLEQLLGQTDAEVADAVGGTISSINVLENIGLPAVYHGRASVAALEREALAIFADCGMGQEAVETMLRKRPAELAPLEKRLTGFVRGLLMRPGVLVFHRFLEGLTRGEMARAVALDRVYRARQPQGTAVHLLLRDMPVTEPACDRRLAL